MQYFLFPLLFLLSACTQSDREVRTYAVQKTAPAPASPAPATMNASAGLSWTTPKNWEEKGGSQMRLASFSTEGKGDASIVVLGGDAGGLTANVNRWRGQIGLEAVSDSAVESASKAMKGALGDFRFFELKSPSAEKDGILAAVFSLASRSVFVKLTGQPNVLKAQRESFLNFCKSIRESNGTRE